MTFVISICHFKCSWEPYQLRNINKVDFCSLKPSIWQHYNNLFLRDRYGKFIFGAYKTVPDVWLFVWKNYLRPQIWVENRQTIMFLWTEPFSLECAITIELIGWQHIIRRGQEFHLLPLGTISRGNKPRKIGDLLPITYLRNSAHKTNTGQFLYWNERKNKIL